MVNADKTFYITTTLPYVNAEPHLGFASEIVRADILARYQRLIGAEVFFNTGVDEHGLKIYHEAEKRKIEPQKYCDEFAGKFSRLKKALNLSYDNFVRTTDEKHCQSAQEFWKRCVVNGDIYKKEYKVKYCVGCELEKTDSELINGECPLHPGKKLEIIEEENYFFRFSKYQKPLLDLYANNPEFVKPHFRLNEIKKFVEQGLQDFSISRLKEKMPWGVEVPGDDEHVMYVWFEALINYISAVGWPDEMEKFEKWWPAVQVAGKDNLRQQTAMWQAMLMSAGIKPSRQIHIFGFVNSEGRKMSKSLGNVVDPLQLVDEYGTDAVRYYIARHLNMYEDSDFTANKFKEIYNANLANGLGNLVSRIMKMAVDYKADFSTPSVELGDCSEFTELMDEFQITATMDLIWDKIKKLDGKIQTEEPFKIAKTDLATAQKMLENYLAELWLIGNLLAPFTPNATEIVLNCIKNSQIPSEPLFLRK